MQLQIQSALPHQSIAPFVHSFWMLENKTGKDIASTILPNGMVDLTWIKRRSGACEVKLRGINTELQHVIIEDGITIFTIGCKLPAVEYLLCERVNDILNNEKHMRDPLWQFDENDTGNLDRFCDKATNQIRAIATETMDARKRKLFELVYASNGTMPVSALSEQSFWSSRQINRYFNQQFGISLKAYCRLLRLGASFRHLSEGQLFPEQSFTDQNHFIKEIKAYSGVTPKDLSRNKNGRFIDITAIHYLPEKND